MSMTYEHMIVTVAVAIIFGVLIDIDHGITMGNLKCALSINKEDCEQAGKRGVFHDLRVWGLAVLGIVVWTIHLIMDEEIVLWNNV
jgi:hypothetical protein